MRIISDFKDYYDIGAQYGIDPQLPYHRVRRFESLEFDRPNSWRLYRDSFAAKFYHAEYHHFYYIGFAGKIYACINVAFHDEKPKFCFDPSLIDDAFFACDFALQYKRKYRHDVKSDRTSFQRMKKEITECYEYKNYPELLDLFEKHKTAIFVCDCSPYRSTVVINESLSRYGFQKVLPPMQAWQELEMYVGSYLTKPTIEEPPISDKIKAEIKGFDKFSFRKDKQKV